MTPRPNSDRRSSRGFTLMEVLIALTIVAIALSSMSVAMGGFLSTATTLRERTYASWIAQNKIVEYRLANEVPETGTTSGEVDFANSTWEWEANVQETGVENLLRIDVSVGFAGSNAVIRSVTGFIGEPVVPGQSNRAWAAGGADEQGDTR
jgi:general secretion pathway protein I